MTFKDGPSALDWVRQKITAGMGGTLAVAFWGTGAVERLGLLNRPIAKPIILICNLAMGGTNPEEVKRLQKLKNVNTLQCDRLHGKVYLLDDEVMLGSSNASANGLSFEGSEATGWAEANFVSSDTNVLATARDWIEKLDCREISPGDLERATIAWEKRRQAMLPTKSGQSIAEILKDANVSLIGKGVYVAFYAEKMTESGYKAVLGKQKETGSDIDAFQDWRDLPRELPIITFRIGKSGRLMFDNVWRLLPETMDGKDKDGLSMQWCFEAPLPLGLKSPRGDLMGWKDVAKWVIQHKGNVDDEQSRFCNLAEVTL